MANYLDSTGLTALWAKIKTYVANAFSAVTQTTSTTARVLKFTKLGGNTTSVTLSAATTSAAGLMSATDKTNMTNVMHLQGTQYFDRSTSISGMSYLSLFKVTPTSITVNGISVTPFPIVEFELVVVSVTSTTSAYVCSTYKCTLCLSSTPTITWEVKNSIGGAVANAVKSIVYDKTNKIVLVGVDSSSSYVKNMYLRTFVYRNDHCTVAASTTTTTVSSNITTFSL